MKKLVYSICLMATMLAVGVQAVVYAAPPGPVIGVPVLNPTAPTSSDPVTVLVNVTSNRGVQNVTIVYTTDNWQSVNATVVASHNATSGLATAQIPALASGGHVAFYIVSYDNNGARSVDNNSGNYYTYDVQASLFGATTSTWIIIGIVAAALGAFAVAFFHFVVKRPESGSRKTGQMSSSR